MLTAIVLAAGTSTRMGNTNKLLLPYKNKTVIATVAENVINAGIGEVIVVTGFEAEKIQQALKGLPVQFVNNPAYAKGMTTSIQHGVLQAKGNGFMICLSDMVLITPHEYSLLNNCFGEQLMHNEKCICIPLYNKEKGNPVIFSSSYKQAILNHTGMEGCKEIVQENKEYIHFIEMNTPHILQDMDYPGDYEKLRKPYL
ncbi:MAG TPA: nucleotidyltransferase family protein [Panacibacter sp.]|nr:nucleotidyltransferase family protein [Panacibacter sp.]